MSATADARGLKRVCVSCGGRFYDLNKRPIVCPSCSTEFSGEIKLKTRRGRLPAAETIIAEPAKAAIANDDRFEEVERAENVVSLEEIEEGKDTDDEDIELEDPVIEDLEEIDDDLKDEEIEVEVEKE